MPYSACQGNDMTTRRRISMHWQLRMKQGSFAWQLPSCLYRYISYKYIWISPQFHLIKGFQVKFQTTSDFGGLFNHGILCCRNTSVVPLGCLVPSGRGGRMVGHQADARGEGKTWGWNWNDALFRTLRALPAWMHHTHTNAPAENVSSWRHPERDMWALIGGHCWPHRDIWQSRWLEAETKLSKQIFLDLKCHIGSSFHFVSGNPMC